MNWDSLLRLFIENVEKIKEKKKKSFQQQITHMGEVNKIDLNL